MAADGRSPLLSADSVVDGVFVGTEDDAPVAVRSDVLVGVFKVIAHEKLNSSVVPTDECQD